VKQLIRKIHRYLGLTMLSLWVVQALTGMLMVFHWELDDVSIRAEHRPLDVARLGERIDALARERPRHVVTSVYPTAGAADRYDIYIENEAGATDAVRVDGAGMVLRERPLDHDFTHTGLIQAAVVLHQSLFAGDLGRSLIGLSGLLLLTNLVLGLKLAWPAMGQWWRALRPAKGARTPTATFYSWHRALGLWLALPASVLITAGILLAFDSSLEHWLGADAAPPGLSNPPPLVSLPIAPALALATALQRYPRSTLSGMRLPTKDEPWYRIRVRQPNEIRRVFGTTVIYVSAADGEVLADESAFSAPLARRFMDILYPIHTGEFVGIAGRVTALAIGTWLVTMLSLGFCLWWSRRARPPRLSAAHEGERA